MLLSSPPRPTRVKPRENEELAFTLERQVRRRTGGRIRQLSVSVSPGRIVVRGISHTFYSKQLALHAVLEVLGQDADEEVDLQIDVVDYPHLANGEYVANSEWLVSSH